MIQWWKSEKTYRKKMLGYAGATSEFHDNLWAKEEDCDFLYEANTNKPSLVNIGMLHGTTTLQIADDGLSVLSHRIKEENSFTGMMHWKFLRIIWRIK